jgi:hypothetical protein
MNKVADLPARRGGYIRLISAELIPPPWRSQLPPFFLEQWDGIRNSDSTIICVGRDYGDVLRTALWIAELTGAFLIDLAAARVLQ